MEKGIFDYMKILLLAFVMLITHALYSQVDDFGSWNVINTKVNLSDRWSVFNELQLRSLSFYNHFYYYEVKGGATYTIDKNFAVLLGFGKYITYSDGGNFVKPITANETRFWQQFTMSQFLERIKFEHRYRAEQRWFSNGSYRNRFRYRLNTVVPLNAKKMGPKTFYFTAFDEIFLTNTTPHFERNRIFGGIGYQFSKHFTLQPGYIYQYNYSNNVGSGKSFLQLTLLIEVSGHKDPREKIPGNVD
jgi:hypothetical protein